MNFDCLLNPISMRRDLHISFESSFIRYMPSDAVVYDIGCGQKPFSDFLEGRVNGHVGVDIADGFYKPEHVDLIGTAYAVPAGDNIADAVILSQVIEHLESPLSAIKEAHRLLKPGGIMFLSFPFLYPQHAAPRDFLRFTEFYIENKLIDEDFEILEQNRIGGYWYLMGMNTSIYLKAFDKGPLRWFGLLKLTIAILSWLFLLLHRAEGLFLNMVGKSEDNFRAPWTVNYLIVLRKKSLDLDGFFIRTEVF